MKTRSEQPADDWIRSLNVASTASRKVAAGESVFRQGQPVAAVYLVERGRVRLVRELEDGSLVTVYVARTGDAFAEAAVFADCYHCHAVAEVDAQVRAIPADALRAALERDPHVCMQWTRALAAQVRELRALLELRNIRGAPERLLAWLRLRAGRVPAVLELDRPWTAISTELGLAHESVYRALATLQRRGLIERQGNRVKLLAG